LEVHLLFFKLTRKMGYSLQVLDGSSRKEGVFNFCHNKLVLKSRRKIKS